jgi:hypothetical protein
MHVSLGGRQVGVAGEVAHVDERDRRVVGEPGDPRVTERVKTTFPSSVIGRAARSRAFRNARWTSCRRRRTPSRLRKTKPVPSESCRSSSSASRASGVGLHPSLVEEPQPNGNGRAAQEEAGAPRCSRRDDRRDLRLASE